ncbi:MAG: HNH endonuclease signature motif containing protein [Acidimicrobiia bacterium]|nr:HNH endonuclease signature motif containing protein [Acidimicrobiia bacterium]
MEERLLEEAIGLVERANAGVTGGLRRDPAELRRLRAWTARRERLASDATASVSARLGDATEVARTRGTSVGAARKVIDTGRHLRREPRLAEAAESGAISLDQAAEIASAATVAPEALDDLVETARGASFRTLRDRARTIRLQSRAPESLAARQRRARRLRHWIGDDGMVRLDAALEPHVGAAVVSRIRTEADRTARTTTDPEPYDRYLADGLATSVTGDPAPGRAEVVVLVSHDIIERGWTDVKDGEHCAIPGVGPIAPSVAKRVAGDAFLSGVFFDGTDLRHLKRWTRHIPIEVRLALRLGEATGFGGPACVDCGDRFGLEIDHVQPVSAGGETSLSNTTWRCDRCHRTKTNRDRTRTARAP